jgi:hypothetical protein
MIPIAGYAPDADPTTPGVLTEVSNIIPNERSYIGAPSGVAPAGVGVLAAACRGAVIATKLDGTRRIIAGTQTKLYEYSAGSWGDVSAAGNYTGSAENRWSFCQFGDFTLASNDTEAIQASSSGAFVALTAPKAKIVITAGNFVVALNTNDATYGDSPDRWRCSAIFDHTDWTVAVSTQANTGRLVQTPGEISAGLPLGNQIAVYKAASVYLASYVGSPEVWRFDVANNDAGCIGQEALCDIDGAHFFVSNDGGFYIFDGARVVPVGEGVISQWFANHSSPAYRYKTLCRFDRQNKRVFVFYVGVDSTTLDQVLVYHLTSKRWGKMYKPVEAALRYVSAGSTIDTMSAVAATIDALTIPVDSQFWQSGGRAFSVFNTSHQLQTLTGEASASSITTGDIGDDGTFTTLKGARVRFLNSPTSATGEVFCKNDAGDDYDPTSQFTMQGNRIDVLQSARFHKLRLDFQGDVEVTAIRYDTVPDGEE